MQQINRFSYLASERPALMGTMRGSAEHPDIEGLVHAYWLDGALYIQAEFEGLPPDRVFGFHVHDGLICGELDGDEPFRQAGSHLKNCPDGTPATRIISGICRRYSRTKTATRLWRYFSARRG